MAAVDLEGGREVRSVETPEEALALAGHPDAAVIHLPADAEWPGEPAEKICRDR